MYMTPEQIEAYNARCREEGYWNPADPFGEMKEIVRVVPYRGVNLIFTPTATFIDGVPKFTWWEKIKMWWNNN
jgi:hypothetical protein